MRRTIITAVGCALLAMHVPLPANEPLGTAWTYQAQLKNNGVPVTDTCDFTFRLWDDPLAGSEVGSSPQGPIPIDVVNGLFKVDIDFGQNAIIGVGRWLETTVDCPGHPAVTLVPRVTLTPAPHALALPGMFTRENLSSPNVIGGYSGNLIDAGIVGGTISGGGQENDAHRVAGNFGTVGGGVSNTATGERSTVGGGWQNHAEGFESTVSGGERNTAAGPGAAIGGGMGNLAPGENATVPGGFANLAGGSISFAGGRGAMVRSAAAVGNSDGDEGTFVWCDANGNLAGRCTSTGSNQFIIQSAGGTGVGTPAPEYTLHVYTNTYGRAIFGHNDGDFEGESFGVYGQSDGDRGVGVYGVATTRGGLNYGVWGETLSSVGFAGYFTGQEGSRNYFQQRVGIGTLNPTEKLHVVGALHLEGTSRDISVPVTEALQLGHWDGVTFTERMRISTNGNVGIGTASPNSALVLQGDDPVFQIRDDTADNSPNAARLELLERAGGNYNSGAFLWWNGLTDKLLLGTKLSGVNTNVMVIDRSTSSVGIGTQNPSNRLSVVGGADFSGNVGIGTTNPNHELVIQGNNPAVQIRDNELDNNPNAARLELLERAGGNFDGGAFFWWNGETNKLLVGTKQSGVNTNVLVIDRATSSVGIGTQTPGNYRLAVNGSIRAKEIVVETGWADFVFEPDYHLRSLEEVEAHITAHGHLPDIPSAREIEANGVRVGEMHSKLLQKIEELTLHMIDMDKRMKSLERENMELRNRLGASSADEGSVK